MLRFYVLLVAVCLKLYVVKCGIPNLKVNKIDGQIVQRKRQDTLEMCRIFKAEYEDANNFKSVYNNGKNMYNNRRKREIGKNNMKAVDVEYFDENVDMKQVAAQTDYKPQIVVPDIINELNKNNLLNKSDENSLKSSRDIIMFTPSVQTVTPAHEMGAVDFAPKLINTPAPPPTQESTEESVAIPWPKRWKHGIVPYFIDPKTYDTFLGETIMKAFDYFEKATCVRLQRLRERPVDKASLKDVEWIYITNPTGIRQCVHTNDQKSNSGVQMVVFGYDCMSLGEILHEVMHVLGFPHEHVRSDRDKYIHILWDNIKPGYMKYFESQPNDALIHLPYDHASVMHYPPRAFSRNGHPTIIAEHNEKIGQREGLSEIDTEKVNYVYAAECLDRNKQYLLKTCPTVVSGFQLPTKKVDQRDVEEYFKNRLWSYGIINYKFKDPIEFTIEERQNIDAVIKHIQKETCIEFRNAESKPENIEEPMYGDIATKSFSGSMDHTNPGLKYIPGNGNDDEEINKRSPEENDVMETEMTNANENKQSETDDNNFPPSNDQSKSVENVAEYRRHMKFDNTMKISTFRHEKSKKGIPRRRHATDVLILARSEEVGCHCPKPGRVEGNQILNITVDCFNSVNDLLHLFVHVLGLEHQHSMHDRDSYLHILWEKLSPEMRQDLNEKLPPAASLGLPYDYQSVMHFPWLQIQNGVTNIMYPIWNDGWAMGHWQGLSSTDVQKIGTLYKDQCDKRKKQESPSE